MISQQLQQMLMISKTVSHSLEVFVSGKIEDIKILAFNRDFAFALRELNKSATQEALNSYVKAQNNDVASVYTVYKTGEFISQYPGTGSVTENYALLKKDLVWVLHEKVTYISKAQRDKDGRFVINLFEPVFLKGEFVGVIISSISLDAMYQQIVKPVKSGQKGYVMVKDGDQIILMHPAKAQVGMDVIDSREQVYPGFYFKELKELIKQQYTNEEGTSIYHSYWWTDKVLKKTKKLNAFTRAHIGNHFWVVAVVMDYNEIEGPIRQNLIQILTISFIILLILSVAIFIILKIQKNKEALEVETKYLKELNQAAAELREKDLQLQHSQKLQVVGTLTGGIAHEFNNLLTPILGYAEILRNKLAPNNETHDYINEIYDASKKAKDIIEQILVFSRLDNGKSKYKSLQVNSLLVETLNLVRSTITPNIEVVYYDKADNCFIMANRVQIHQVILNLCTNAFHAMKYTGGTLTVSLDIGEKEETYDTVYNAEGYVRITISDTGHGMNKETLARIFDPFYTTKPTGEGTGLGLFIVQGIIRNHKGFITVESEVGQRSTFKVYLPRVLERKEEPEQIETDILKEEKSVLLVDDEQKVLKAMKKGLEQYGLKVTAEDNSVEALKIFNKNPSRFDVIITDQAMPYLKGTELAERLKAINPWIKIILVTGYADEKVLEYLDRMIIDDYITKPVTGTQLVRTIRKILEKE
jgi:signal transduction histidine kinase/ActR/RegA family two-component response regulator